ncbi:MAG: Do family serine endopeptidase [Alphaproteobacteria bacterium]|nr:Do family serine endopeptidase [Alphaproteobacteria bacterium]
MKTRYCLMSLLLSTSVFCDNFAQNVEPQLISNSDSFTDRQAPTSILQTKLSFAPIVKKTAPTVVNIYTQRVVQSRESNLMADPFFRQFFGHDLKLSVPRDRIERSLGSGVIVSPEGLIVTCHHVVQDSDQINVVLSDKREFQAKVVKLDPKSDLAILKINPSKGALPFSDIGTAESSEIGDLVLAIGNPFGLDQTVTSGIVSAKKTIMGAYVIQTDAAINIGNSGGGLFDMEGRLIGINSAIYSKTGGSNGIGFAVPSEMVKVVLQSVGSQKPPQKPWLGIQGSEVTPIIAEAMGIDLPIGVYVNKLYPKGPADIAGLKVGDVIRKVDGKDITDISGLEFIVATRQAGTETAIEIMREGKLHHVRFPLTPPTDTIPRETTKLGGKHPLTGAIVANLSPALATELSLNVFDGGVVITKSPQDTTPFRLGFEEGDLILQINNQKIGNVKELTENLNSAKAQWVISFKRGQEILSISVRA